MGIRVYFNYPLTWMLWSALGSSAAFGYSLVVLYLMIDAMSQGQMMKVMSLGHDLYFESAAMIPTLITVGKM